MTTTITAEDVRRPESDRRYACPLCGAHRGVSLALKDDKLVAHCHAGCCDVYGWLRDRDWLPRHERPQRTAPEHVSQDEQNTAKLRRAFSILYAAANANAGQPVDYLAGRGIHVVPPGAMLMPREVSRKVLQRNFPAMVLPVCDKDGHLVGAQATLLSRDGSKRVKGGKRSYGNVRGGFVQLGAVDSKRPLIVAEGIETALAASQIAGGVPAIACLGTSNMKTVGIPECAEVIIAADPGEAGQEAATVLAERTVQHRITRIATPREGDWADALKKYRDDPEKMLALRRRIVKARKFTAQPQLRAVSREEFCGLNIPKTTHFLAPILPVAGATVIHGQKCNGKSRLVLSMAECMATQGELLDWRSEVKARVLYIDGELPPRTMQHRLERLGPTEGNLHVISRYEQLQRGVRMGKLTSPELRAEIDRIVDGEGFNVITLDSFSSLIGESENDIAYWPAIEDWIMEHRGCGRSTILVMHEGNETGRPRGLTKIRDQFDNLIRVSGLPERHEADPDNFYFKIENKAIRDEGEDDYRPRQIAMVPKIGKTLWEFVEVPERSACTKRQQQRAERNQQIVELAKTGMSLRDIARAISERFGKISHETIRTIVRASRNEEQGP